MKKLMTLSIALVPMMLHAQSRNLPVRELPVPNIPDLKKVAKLGYKYKGKLKFKRPAGTLIKSKKSLRPRNDKELVSFHEFQMVTRSGHNMTKKLSLRELKKIGKVKLGFDGGFSPKIGRTKKWRLFPAVIKNPILEDQDLNLNPEAIHQFKWL